MVTFAGTPHNPCMHELRLLFRQIPEGLCWCLGEGRVRRDLAGGVHSGGRSAACIAALSRRDIRFHFVWCASREIDLA